MSELLDQIAKAIALRDTTDEMAMARVAVEAAGVRELIGGLLWLRNHYELDKRRDPFVMQTIDHVLDFYDSRAADHKAFRERFISPRKATEPTK